MGRSLQKPVAKVGDFKFIPSVANGGTGSSTADQAAAQLGLVSTLTLGFNGRVAKTGEDGKLPASSMPSAVVTGPTLDGPAEVFVNQTVTYKITNYDQLAAYALSATAGTLSRTADVIAYTAPTSVQSVTLDINGRQIALTVRPTGPVTPTVISPVAGAANILSGMIMAGSTFALSTGTGAHLSSDWQLANDELFSNVVQSSFNDTVNKTTWPVSSLLENTRYFVRVRYKDVTAGTSNWSLAASFTTKVSFTAFAEEAFVSHADRVTGDNLGGLVNQQVAVTADGTRAFLSTITKNNTQTGQGAVYVFSRIGSTWSQEAKLIHSPIAASEQFGCALSVSYDGTRVVIGSQGRTNTATNQGAVYVFTRTGVTWSQEAVLYHGDVANSDRFGSSVSVNAAGTRFAAGAFNKTGAAATEGAVYVFNRIDTVWIQEAKISRPAALAAAWFGYGVALTADGNRLVVSGSNSSSVYVFTRVLGGGWALEGTLSVGTYTTPVSYWVAVKVSDQGDRVVVGLRSSTLTTTAQGLVLIYARTGTTWTQEAVLSLPTPLAYDQFGSDVAFNSDASILVVGANKATQSLSSQGAVYVYVRIASTWTLRTILVASNAIAGGMFGSSVALSDDGTRLVVGAGNATVSSTTGAGCGHIYS